ncbi:MAG: hypothetical protein R2697_18220 [Ilumatobacteraceae bacterium]
MGDSVDLRNVFAEFVGTVLVMLAGLLLVLAGDSVGTVGVAIGFGADGAGDRRDRCRGQPDVLARTVLLACITGHQLVTDLIG